MGISKLLEWGGVELKTFTHLSFLKRRARSDLYKKVISLPNLFQAWDEFKKGKRKKIDVGEFERHLEDNIFELRRELLTKTYRHSSYTGFYITDPKVRHIHKAIVRDRIVHHALFKVLNPIFEPTFISDSFSCRKGYGTHKGFKKLVVYARKVSKNYTQDGWALKCDVKKFFDSVNHKVLLEIIKRKIKEKDLLWLLEEIVGSFCTCHSEVKPKNLRSFANAQDDDYCKGIPIGNLTSQLFANVYLNELDQFVKNELKDRYYIRYADDLLILIENTKGLVQYTGILDKFLEDRLKLELHPNKISLRKLPWGVDFVGYIALPHYQVLRTKTKRRIYRKIRERILVTMQKTLTTNP